MNVTIISGRLTKEVEVKKGVTGADYLSNSIAVERPFKNKDGKKDTDFIPIIVFGHNATFLGKYAAKGARVNVKGSLRTRSYEDKDNGKRFVLELQVDEVEIMDWKNSDSSPSSESVSEGKRPAANKANTFSEPQGESLEDTYGDIDLETFF